MALARTKAQKALERVRHAGSLARREAKQRSGVLVGTGCAAIIGWAEQAGRMTKLGPFHISLLGVPGVFATSLFSRSEGWRQVEAASGPLLGIAAYKLAKGEAVLGDEYGSAAGEYG